MNINKILVGLFLLAGAIQSCKEDGMEEITALQLERALSPTEVAATIVNKTGVKLNWTPVGTAKYYRAEIFENPEFSGTPVKVVDSIGIAQIPFTITGLAGETSYYARIKALGAGSEDSKWRTVNFQTDAEQILHDIDQSKLTANSVTINWPAGEVATSLVITPGNITHTVSSSEVAAGEVTISGLTGETFYTVKLYNGAKVRGTKTFTTLIDLGGAIQVNPSDDLAAILTNANGGETFALMPGTYSVNADVNITKSISLKGAKPTDRPIVKGLALKIKGNAALTLKDVIFDGKDAAGTSINSYTLSYDEASDNAYGPLDIQDSEMRNYQKGLLSVSLKTLIESVVIKGNVIYNFDCNSSDFIDFRNGIAKTFLFENNTVYNAATTNVRDLFRMDAPGGTNFSAVTSAITLKNNTFNNVSNSGTATSGGRILYIRLGKHTIDVINNIIANTNAYYTNQSATTISTLNNNNYFNAPNFLSQVVSSSKFDGSSTKTTLDPGFTNVGDGKFNVTNETLKEKGVGDPRWLK